jgi:NIMA-interacting peptidyl-prolyl cis-trans isomerase 1
MRPRTPLRPGIALAMAALALPLAISAAGCGEPTPPMHPSTQAAPPEEPAPGSPAAQCIALASAKRERKPNEPAKVSVKHLLVKYAGAERADQTITRTREAACMRALEARDKLRAGADIAEIVKEYSEEPGAASREGLVPSFERSFVVEPFADAAFELDVGQLSDVVETPYGFHIMLRTE